MMGSGGRSRATVLAAEVPGNNLPFLPGIKLVDLHASVRFTRFSSLLPEYGNVIANSAILPQHIFLSGVYS